MLFSVVIVIYTVQSQPFLGGHALGVLLAVRVCLAIIRDEVLEGFPVLRLELAERVARSRYDLELEIALGTIDELAPVDDVVE